MNKQEYVKSLLQAQFMNTRYSNKELAGFMISDPKLKSLSLNSLTTYVSRARRELGNTSTQQSPVVETLEVTEVDMNKPVSFFFKPSNLARRDGLNHCVQEYFHFDISDITDDSLEEMVFTLSPEMMVELTVEVYGYGYVLSLVPSQEDAVTDITSTFLEYLFDGAKTRSDHFTKEELLELYQNVEGNISHALPEPPEDIFENYWLMENWIRATYKNSDTVKEIPEVATHDIVLMNASSPMASVSWEKYVNQLSSPDVAAFCVFEEYPVHTTYDPNTGKLELGPCSGYGHSLYDALSSMLAFVIHNHQANVNLTIILEDKLDTTSQYTTLEDLKTVLWSIRTLTNWSINLVAHADNEQIKHFADSMGIDRTNVYLYDSWSTTTDDIMDKLAAAVKKRTTKGMLINQVGTTFNYFH